MLGAGVQQDVAELGAHDADAAAGSAVRRFAGDARIAGLLPIQDRAVDVAIVVDGLDARVAEPDFAEAVVDAERFVEHDEGVG